MNYRLTLLAAVLVLGSVAAPARAAAIPPPPGSFTIVLLPDTQRYSQTYPDLYAAQTQWIKDNRNSHNIQYVLHLGDIVNNNNAAQWNNAKAAMSILDEFVPYAMAPGNHDYSSNRSTMFNLDTYFGPNSAYVTEQPTFGGVYETGKTDNSYHTFSAGGTDWLVLALEFGPRDDVVDWANQVVADHPDHQAMLVTHAYMYYTEVRYDWATYGTAQSWNPHNYSSMANLPGGVNDGQELWDDLVSQHENFAFTFNGHVLSDGTGYLGSLGAGGNVVHQMLANYQMITSGGNGYMRLLEFLPDGETVQVRTYSPVTDAYDDDFDQHFTLNMNEIHPPLVPLPPPILYHAVGGNVVVDGPVDPSTNTVGVVAVPQSALPGVSTLKVNRGDYQIAVDGDGLHYEHGVLLASVTENVRDGIRATVEVGRSSFSDGLLSLSVMEAGNSSGNEVNVNTSVAWFMFDAGWQGAHVNEDGTIGAASAVDQSMLTRNGTGRYALDLGVDATASDGMLFAVANNNGNTVVHTSVAPNGTWDLRVQD
ncbi:MAG: metallophosphoesterase, partial [Planctomycetota bacterium]